MSRTMPSAHTHAMASADLTPPTLLFSRASGLLIFQIADETGGLFQLLQRAERSFDALVPIVVVTAEREFDRQLLTARCAELVQALEQRMRIHSPRSFSCHYTF